MTPTLLQRAEFRIIDANVTAITQPELLNQIREGIEANDRRVIAHHNLHSLYLFQTREKFRNFYNTQVFSTPIDGMPLVWMARLYGRRIQRDTRVTYVDFLPPLLEMAAANGWRTFYLGSRPEACARGSEILLSRYPHLKLRSVHGYFDVTREGEANRRIVDEIAAFRPALLIVGMGMPRQEEWIAENLQDLKAGVILCAGAAIDYLAGAVPTPPRWAGRIGLEWLFRLAAEPRRLSGRYLIEPWYVLAALIRDLSRGQRQGAPKADEWGIVVNEQNQS